MKKLSDRDYDDLIRGAEVVAADAHGDKVLRTPAGEIVKLFRLKRLWSSARIWPYALRFRRNAQMLHTQGIPTVEVLETYRVTGIRRDIVVYRELPGRSLRETLLDPRLQRAEKTHRFEQLAALLGVLHARGIIFRSIHFGNVLIQANDTLALIDVADMRKRYVGPLNAAQRLRNFRHMLRYEIDRRALGEFGVGVFVANYLAAASLNGNPAKKLQTSLIAALSSICRP